MKQTTLWLIAASLLSAGIATVSVYAFWEKKAEVKFARQRAKERETELIARVESVQDSAAAAAKEAAKLKEHQIDSLQKDCAMQLRAARRAGSMKVGKNASVIINNN